jgi:hypothetical protein
MADPFIKMPILDVAGHVSEDVLPDISDHLAALGLGTMAAANTGDYVSGVAAQTLTDGGERARSNIGAATHAGVKLAHEAATSGYLPVGIDKANAVVYARVEKQTNGLYKTTDPSLQQWTFVYHFTDNSISSLEAVFVTASGSLLALTSNGTTGYLYRSTDGGATWTQVLTGTGLGATRRSFAQLANGSIFYGQYITISGTYTLSIYKSTDDGVTWTTAKQWTNAGQSVTNDERHVHFVRADPFVSNRLWLSDGDQDNQCFIGYSDDDLANITVIGSGDQTWRSVDLLLTADAVIWGMDNPDSAQQVWRWDRTTQTRKSLLDDAGSSLYYGGIDSAGRMFWGTTYESVGAHQNKESRIYTGRDDGQPWQMALRYRVKPGGTRKDIYPFGPDVNGSFYLGWMDTLSTGPTYRLVRAVLTDADTTSADAPPLLNAQPKPPSQPLYLFVADPRIFPFSQGSTLGAVGRLWLMHFRPEHDMLVNKVSFKVITAAGNIAAAIYDATGSTTPIPLAVNQLATTGSVACPAAGAATLTFGSPILLKAGVDYHLGISGDTATCSLNGGDSTTLAAFGQARFVDTAFPPPATIAASTGTTRSYGSVLYFA